MVVGFTRLATSWGLKYLLLSGGALPQLAIGHQAVSLRGFRDPHLIFSLPLLEDLKNDLDEGENIVSVTSDGAIYPSVLRPRPDTHCWMSARSLTLRLSAISSSG